MTFWDGTRWVPDAPSPGAVRARSRVLGHVGEAMLITALMFALIASTALAAKRTGASLSVEPNAAPAWGWATATGCGYGSSEVYLDVEKPEALAFMSTMPDAAGCISLSFTTDGPGMYELSARQLVRNRWKTMASYSLPVE